VNSTISGHPSRSIIVLADSLSLDVVAGGIENDSERAMLKKLGRLEGHGYYFGKPLLSCQVAHRLAN